MRLSTFLPTLGLAGQALATGSLHRCNTQWPRNAGVASDAQVTDYFAKLASATKRTLLHETTGPEIGAEPGVVSAIIPNPDQPEWAVYWLRDACFVYHLWLNEFTVQGDTSLRPIADDLTHALIRTQQVISYAGNVFTGGLEEPVFDLKIRALEDVNARIGSPAADGPPFRANILLKYAEWLIKPEQNNCTWAADVLWPKLNLDLQWVSSHWNESSWDFWWFPIWGGSYWTASVQYRALKGGARLERAINRGLDVVGEYDSRAQLILDYMQTFWNEKEGFMTETTITDVNQGRSGYGSAALVTSVYNFDPSLGCDDATFQPCSPRALSSLKVVGDRFKEVFPISQNSTSEQLPFYGFFLEDEFLGGHPQFLTSFSSAEQLYDALITWDLVGSLEVTPVDLKFWKQFDSSVKIGRYNKGSEKYTELTKAVREWSNKIVLQLAAHTPTDYVLPLCIHKEEGGPYGPRGAILSLSAALGAYDAYNGVIPPNWGHPIPNQSDDHEVSAETDEVIDDWNRHADYGYHGIDPTICAQQSLAIAMEDIIILRWPGGTMAANGMRQK